jgi:hypothetical protein
MAGKHGLAILLQIGASIALKDIRQLWHDPSPDYKIFGLEGGH